MTRGIANLGQVAHGQGVRLSQYEAAMLFFGTATERLYSELQLVSQLKQQKPSLTKSKMLTMGSNFVQNHKFLLLC